MAQSHHHAAGRARRHLELRRQRCFLDGERVVARRCERVGQAAEHADAFMLDLAHLAVQQLWGTFDPGAESDADRLMAETDAEHGQLLGAMTDQLDADTRVFGSARTR